MKPDKRYRLKLKSLNFISAVDRPAQETATALLIKRAPRGDGTVGVTSTARVVKVEEELGIVFGWAMTPTAKGADYVDLHGDVIDAESMVKVAADFMAGKRAQDVMHDESPDGTVIFGMPLTKEIAGAFGIETDTTGLMVGIKPSAEVLEKFKDGTYTGFSIGGTGVREEMKRAAADVDRSGAADVKAMKRARLTTDVEGHAHLFEDGLDSGTTSGTEMFPGVDGYSRWHYHPYVRNEDGSITIGAAMGHTHDAAGAAAKRAPQPANPKPAPTTEKTMDPKILKAFAELTDDQVAHYRGLPADEREAFLAKSAPERAAIVKAALELDPVIEVAGRSIRKSQDPTGMVVEALKRAEQAEQAAKANADKAADVELEKRATDLLGHLPGAIGVRKALLRAVEGIADEETRKGALAALAAADKALAPAFKTGGFDGGAPLDGSPLDELRKRAEARAAKENVSYEVAYDAELDTAEGARLYAASRAGN